MLAPEIIEKIKKERKDRERQERPGLRLPLPLPEIRNPEEPIEHEEKTDRIAIIDMA